MKKTTKGIAAGLAGIALLAGGSTFALWNDGGWNTASEIQTGQMSASQRGTIVWSDMSSGTAVPVDAQTWKASPGDTIRMTANIGITNTGSNAEAVFTASLPGAAAALEGKEITGTYALYTETGALVGGNAATPLNQSLATPVGKGNIDYKLHVDLVFAEGATGSQGQLISLGRLNYGISQTPRTPVQ